MSLISRHGTSRGYRADGSVCTCSCHDGIGVHIAACCSVAPPDTSSAGAGDAYPTASDREVLQYLMQQFDAETWECPRCGHSEGCKTTDSADYLRRYLASPIAGGQASEGYTLAQIKAAWVNSVPLLGDYLDRFIVALADAQGERL